MQNNSNAYILLNYICEADSLARVKCSASHRLGADWELGWEFVHGPTQFVHGPTQLTQNNQNLLILMFVIY